MQHPRFRVSTQQRLVVVGMLALDTAENKERKTKNFLSPETNDFANVWRRNLQVLDIKEIEGNMEILKTNNANGETLNT